MSIEINQDKKGRNIWVVTKTNSEGYHQQLALTEDELDMLVRIWQEERKDLGQIVDEELGCKPFGYES